MIPLYDDQPTRRPPIATVAIILLNVAVFVLWQLPSGLNRTVLQAGFVPEALTEHEPGAMTHLITSMFMHGGWMHLLGNMWFLWIFGKNVEDVCGHIRFVCFYVLSGAGATLLYAMFSPDSEVPLVGASGAISGVLGAYLLKFPKATVRTLVFFGFTTIINIPAFLFLLIWIGMQLYLQTASHASHQTGGVAYMAHIGGFVAGCILIFIFQGSEPPPPPRYREDEW